MEKSLYIMTCYYSSTGIPEELLIVKVGFYMEKSLYIMTCYYSSTGIPEELLIVKVGFYMEKSLYIIHYDLLLVQAYLRNF